MGNRDSLTNLLSSVDSWSSAFSINHAIWASWPICIWGRVHQKFASSSLFFCGLISSARRSCMRKDAQSLGSIPATISSFQWPRIIQYLGRLRDSLARGTDSTLFRSPWIANLSSLVPTWLFWRLLTKMWWGSLTPPYLAISPSTQRGYASLLILHLQASAQ